MLETDFPTLQLHARGKVRDLYAVAEWLLLVATDRISAFDHVLGSGVPDKGRILTQLSLFWFDFLRDIVPNHLISAHVEDYPPELQPYTDVLTGRSMLVAKAQMFPVECVVRGYLSGSGWQDYKRTGKVCGLALPSGMEESQQLQEPIFTPATKSMDGEHDENISFDAMSQRIGAAQAERLRELSLHLYRAASSHAASVGLILADTKFEFGVTAKGIVLADEVLTPDSSRYWPAEGYAPGRAQPSFDKQFVRDYLQKSGWNKQAPGPPLPEDVVAKTSEKYMEAYRLLTGKDDLDS